ncbi:MAG: pyruvate formate lyase-activating protein [Clostridia bacterium]|nr:pyruvate formate lyase-activating protein [Clostridia bacterium]
MVKGRLHSVESFGTVDGPGIRFVAFLQGCPLRCKYCHNPDSWTAGAGQEISAEELAKNALKYKSYIKNGGVTVSGGEPLMQIDFVTELFKILKGRGVHTAADTSGATFFADDSECVSKHKKLLEYTDLVLLDIKHIDDNEHKKLTGKSNKNTLDFAKYLSDNGKDIWIRHVLVPGITDNDEYLYRLKDFIDTLKTVKKIEVLPYHTMGVTKYENLGIAYPLKGVEPPTAERIENAKRILTLR